MPQRYKVKTKPSPPNTSISARDAYFWHVTAGWQKNILGFGATTIYGEYQQAKDMLGLDASGSFGRTSWTLSVRSEASMWGAGVVQQIDAAAMEIFLAYKNYNAEADVSGSVTRLTTTAGGLKADFSDFQAVVVGTRIQF